METTLASAETIIAQTSAAVSPTLIWLQANAIPMALGLIILGVGWFLAGVMSRQVRHLLPRTRAIDQTLAPLVSQLVRYAVMVITLIIVLGQFGVQTASILAVLGAAGLAIALALQGTLSNLAAGILLVWLRPFNVGEYIDAEGIAGTVVEIGLFGSRLRTYDGIYIHAPNSRLWNTRVTNFTREKTRMVEIKVGIGYGANLARAREVLMEIARDERVLPDPAPTVFVDQLGESSVVVGLRVWVPGTEWWKTRVDLTEQIKLRFDEAGIEIPYNKLDLYLKRPGAGGTASPQT